MVNEALMRASALCRHDARSGPPGRRAAVLRLRERLETRRRRDDIKSRDGQTSRSRLCPASRSRAEPGFSFGVIASFPPPYVRASPARHHAQLEMRRGGLSGFYCWAGSSAAGACSAGFGFGFLTGGFG